MDQEGAAKLLEELGYSGTRDERAWLAAALHRLSARERQMLTARYGLDGDPPLTYRQLAAHLGLSPGRVWQVAARARDKLRALGQARERPPEVAMLWTLPTLVRNALQRAGYTRREQIARATDQELLTIRHLGPLGLRAVRRVIPYVGGHE